MGVLDTCTYIDLVDLDAAELPERWELTAVSLAELHQGVAMAKDPFTRAARSEVLSSAVRMFDPLPFDGNAVTRYGSLVALTVATGRDPRPRRMDLMIAAITSARGLPLYTRNPGDFKGLDGLLSVYAV
ncbi:type II toxin-antitoxin system VapC family toxin [Kribbella italica]|uniref:Putative nucleic acid-binding protein n=1 Tax=Kribbella italica TaxID=1540520 RepID=A0A7W9J711_9ACTN|nr:type II toxin-antitoxin system VapC family toxin [Kribbella italica]MBB5836514.1 putative nucleic acid-binding protein [Kribbella italica]